MTKLEQFEWDLKRYGQGLAPNGATYKLRSDGKVTRYGNRTRDGVNEMQDVIVGFNGRAFATQLEAFFWCLADGRCELPNDSSIPLSSRKVLA